MFEDARVGLRDLATEADIMIDCTVADIPHVFPNSVARQFPLRGLDAARSHFANLDD